MPPPLACVRKASQATPTKLLVKAMVEHILCRYYKWDLLIARAKFESFLRFSLGIERK